MSGRTTQAEQETELAGLIVRTLNLDIKASEIDPEGTLFGEGLGLDRSTCWKSPWQSHRTTACAALGR